ncbi:MAG: hypothetical protein QOD01_715 [Actinomycetota bacterium]|nr:hypothetical protein [Actinomycetota bacterium]
MNGVAEMAGLRLLPPVLVAFLVFLAADQPGIHQDCHKGTA